MAVSDIDDFADFCDYMIKYSRAISDGAENFVAFLPTMIRQHMKVLAQNRLTTTKDVFLDAISMKSEQNVLVVALDEDDWLANATEMGCDPFDMKNRLKTSSKAKISKSGFRYMVIPIKQSKSAKGSDTDKGQAFQALISQTLTKPKFKPARQKLNINGTLDILEEVITNDKRMQGMYRVKKYSSPSAKEQGGRPMSTGYVLFRVMSEKYPEKWLHPGIKAANILRDTEVWLAGIIEPTLVDFIEKEIKDIT